MVLGRYGPATFDFNVRFFFERVHGLGFIMIDVQDAPYAAWRHAWDRGALEELA